MKQKSILIALSIFTIILIFTGCSTPNVDKYKTPIYKTLPKSLSIEMVKDVRTPNEMTEQFSNVADINAILSKRFTESAIFEKVRTVEKSDYSTDYTLESDISYYGVKMNMTFLTYFVDLLYGGAAVAAYVAGIEPLGHVMLGVGALDFLVNGLAGKRMYNHDYGISYNFRFKDKSGNIIWQDTASYKFSFKYTHWGYYDGYFRNDVEKINNAAMEFVSSVAVEHAFLGITEKLGVERLSSIKINKYDNYKSYIGCSIGLIEINVKRQKL